MRLSERSLATLLAPTLTAAAALAGLAVLGPPAQATPDGSQVVISEVYGAGGLAASGSLPASSYTNDFIELANPTSAAMHGNSSVVVNVPSRSKQYAVLMRGVPVRTTLAGYLRDC